MHVEEMAAAIGRAHGAALDEMTRLLWVAVAAGQVGDEDATQLSAAIEMRRVPRAAAQAAAGLGSLPGRVIVPPRKHQRPPDRAEARERSRRWAAAGRMPPAIAAKFTSGEQAALAVIAVEVTKRKACMMAIGAVAALAGVSESTVKRAIRQARALGFLTVQERRLSRFRNDTNIVRITAKAWTSWLELRGSRGGGQRCTGTNTSDLKRHRQELTEAMQRAAEGQKLFERSGLSEPRMGTRAIA